MELYLIKLENLYTNSNDGIYDFEILVFFQQNLKMIYYYLTIFIKVRFLFFFRIFR